MVGFKISTLAAFIMASMALISCVPQAKQTECGPNEAFSATQRKCLPVNPSETSFIKIKAPVPTAGITQEAESGSQLTFSVMIDNPYNRPYRIRWVRNFNGTQYTLYTPSAASSNIEDHHYLIHLIPRNHLFGAVGSHIITAQILEANNNNIIDSHDFSLTLTNKPTPNGQSFTPSLTQPLTYNANNSTNVNFTFSILRNNRALEIPRVRWTLTKLTGEPHEVLEEDDTFLNINTPQVVAFTFNPANPFKETPVPAAPYTNYIGNYRLEANILDLGTGESFSSYTWDITIKHPNLGSISSATFPVPGSSTSSIRAFNGIAYDFPANPPEPTASNFSYGNNQRAQFCVKVSDPDGRYGGGVKVRYYLGNDTGHVYEAQTSISDDTICLDDPENTNKSAVVFFNDNPELTWNTSITARVFDVDTNEEYKTYIGGTDPLVWNVVVEPRNKAPIVSFEDVPGSVSCDLPSSTATVRKKCSVIQDQDSVNNSFVVAFRVTDEHYTGTTLLDSKIQYQGFLTRGATTINSTSCTKAFSDTGTTTDDGISNIDDYQGPVYTCRFNVPAADDFGSIHPVPQNWKVTVNVTDNGSPYTTDQKSSSIVWELEVTELNTAPYTASSEVALNVAPYHPITSAAEKDTIVFSLNFGDLEKDSYTIELHKCENLVVCSDSNPLKGPYSVTFSDPDWGPKPGNPNIRNRRLVFTIPDGFVPDTIAATPVRFRVRVIENSSTPTAVDENSYPAPTHIINLYHTIDITNHNPPPVFAQPNKLDVNIAGFDPANPLGIDFTVFGSFPITLDPGEITDASNVATADSPANSAEGQIKYQWWISPNNSSWTEIIGAKQKLLRWSPGTEIASGNYYIKLCITDSSPLRAGQNNPVSGTLCNAPALVKVENNIAIGDLVDTADANDFRMMWGAPAVWVDTSATGTIPSHPNSKVIYAAYAVRSTANGIPSETFGVDNVKIHVAKFFYNADNNGSFEKLEEFSFDALDTWDMVQNKTYDVKDLQLVGDDNSLFIAYLSYVQNNLDISGYRPEIRRIVKDFGDTYNKGERTSSLHPGTFGFGYYGYFVRHDQPGCDCWDLGNPQVTPVNVQGGKIVLTTTNLVAGSLIEFSLDGTNWVDFLVAGTTEVDRANDLVTKINKSEELEMKGFVARVTGAGSNEVEIWGPMYNDYRRINQVAEKLGNIFIDNGYLYIPFINGSTPAPDTNSIMIASFATGATSPLDGQAVNPPVTFAGTKALDFDNVIDHEGNLLLAFISNNEPGQAKLVKFNGVDLSAPSPAVNILSDKNLTRVKLSKNHAPTDNDNYFVMGRSSDSKLWISRIPSNLSDLSRVWSLEDTADNKTSGAVAALPLIYDFNIKSAMKDSNLSPSTDEARILLYAADGIYAFRALADQTVTCGDCLPINKNHQLAPNTGYRLMDVSDIIPAQTLGTSGNLYLTESTRNMMVYAHIGQDTFASSTEQRLYLGIINADNTTTDSDTRDDGNGYWAPAIFKK